MRATLQAVTKEGIWNYAQTPRPKWINDSLGMVTLAGSQVRWTVSLAASSPDSEHRAAFRAPVTILVTQPSVVHGLRICKHPHAHIQLRRHPHHCRYGGHGRLKTPSGACRPVTSMR